MLQRDIETLSDRLRQLTSKLVGEMAWSHCVKEVSGTRKMQELIAWLLLVKKIGKGTGKNAEKYRSNARAAIKGCGDAVPVWIMPLSKALNAFTWRIITSSAKPEKRIVAHKASIIEIVKITIEGAHGECQMIFRRNCS